MYILYYIVHDWEYMHGKNISIYGFLFLFSEGGGAGVE